MIVLRQKDESSLEQRLHQEGAAEVEKGKEEGLSSFLIQSSPYWVFFSDLFIMVKPDF